MAAFVELFGDTLLTKDGAKPTAEVLGEATAVAIYFSAHWCPPCRGFTPQLAAMYTDAFAAKGMAGRRHGPGSFKADFQVSTRILG